MDNSPLKRPFKIEINFEFIVVIALVGYIVIALLGTTDARKDYERILGSLVSGYVGYDYKGNQAQKQLPKTEVK